MGCNYYWHEEPPCPECHRRFEALHIGKSSGGWCFSLHVIPEDGINDMPDWEDRWNRPGSEIRDEYGRRVTPTEMRAVILARSWPNDSSRDHAFYEQNHAEPGPAGLARHRIGQHCIGHGQGTYDLITGEFS